MLWQERLTIFLSKPRALVVRAAAAWCFWVMAPLAAQTVTVIYSLSENASYSGTMPNAALVQGIDGSLYGTTTSGGAYGFGTVFGVTTAGALTTIYSFPQAANPNGLIQAVNRNLYGTTRSGGTGTYGNGGTVFEITTGGTLTTIYNFCSQANCADGAEPIGNLVQAANGAIYGTTYAGGTGGAGGGTMFEITPAGEFETVASLGRAGLPESLLLAASGNVDFIGNGGYFYELSASTGKLEAVVQGSPFFTSGYAFTQASNGNFYGADSWGATPDGAAIFELTPSGTTVISNNLPGNVKGAMVQATDGNIYGALVGNDDRAPGGFLCGPTNSAYGCGSLFAVTLPGSVNPGLYFFCTENYEQDCPAYQPVGLIQATDGNLYGVTEGGENFGGLSFSGSVVFKLSIGQGPFVKPLPTSGKVGAGVYILGTNLTGATAVSFNGTPATSFKVNATGSAIGAVVPTGATTGPIQVTTLGGTLSSNVPFRIP